MVEIIRLWRQNEHEIYTNLELFEFSTFLHTKPYQFYFLLMNGINLWMWPPVQTDFSFLNFTLWLPSRSLSYSSLTCETSGHFTRQNTDYTVHARVNLTPLSKTKVFCYINSVSIKSHLHWLYTHELPSYWLRELRSSVTLNQSTLRIIYTDYIHTSYPYTDLQS